MPLTRWDPFESLVPLREAMNRMFEESFISPRFELFAFGRAFPVDVYETEDHLSYVVEASLPGMKPEEVQITALGDTLTIKAMKKEEKKVEKEAYVHHERYEGEMTRTIVLPGTINPEAVEATYEHGILTLRVPKAEEVKPKQISVKIKEAVGVA
ncbi:MAG: Hsp20/alpha crystallin family protein [Ktedonobacteraceae bacterium]